MKWYDMLIYKLFYWRFVFIFENNRELGEWFAHYILSYYENLDEALKGDE